MPPKEVITEDDVRRMAPGDVLVLGPGRLATPSALDLACERGIPVRHESDGPRTPSASAARPTSIAAARLGELRDGRYLVDVANGRVQLWRLTDRGPELVSE